MTKEQMEKYQEFLEYKKIYKRNNSLNIILAKK